MVLSVKQTGIGKILHMAYSAIPYMFFCFLCGSILGSPKPGSH